MASKRELKVEITRTKENFKLLKDLLALDLNEQVQALCSQRNPDEKTHLQGQIYKLQEYINLLK